MITDLIQNPKEWKRHVVILGAGASLATLPDGDLNGRRLPIMSNLIEIVGLEDLVGQLKKTSNFEDVYSELYERGDHPALLRQLEQRVYDYFSSLELFVHPTIYDYLVLALRRKDVIATFNWDPLLVQAWERCKAITPNLPHLLFLHGNVRVAVCHEHRIIGRAQSVCTKCGKELIPTKLLYPIGEKNYDRDPFIAEQWNILRQAINQAYALTIFGYGAPKTDLSAIELMKSAWGDIEDRSMEQVEIIDIKGREELAETWSPFIHTHHYDTHKSFFDSHLAQVPRRSTEAYHDMFFMAKWIGNHPYSQNLSFDELEAFVRNIPQYER